MNHRVPTHERRLHQPLTFLEKVMYGAMVLAALAFVLACGLAAAIHESRLEPYAVFAGSLD